MQTPKLLWLKKNKPEVWDGAQDFFDLADFLTFKVNIAFIASILIYSVVSIKRTGSLNYFGVFSHPVLFFHVLKKNLHHPVLFFHVLKKNFAPPCSRITSCSLNRYYRVVAH